MERHHPSPKRRGTAARATLALILVGFVSCTMIAAAHAEDANACIRSWSEARYVVGYNHIVHIQNSCSADAVCDVTTDVSDRAQTVTVPRGAELAVTTYLGATTSHFKFAVHCGLAS